MKLNKVNNNGSLSVILPKSITEKMIWHQGKEVKVSINTEDSVLITSDIGTITMEQFLQRLQDVLQVYNSVADMPTIDGLPSPTREMKAQLIKHQLLCLLSKQIQ